jgi:hypothetical protein
MDQKVSAETRALVKCANEAIELQELIDQREEELAALKASQLVLLRDRIPDLITMTGQDEWRGQGYAITVEDKVTGGLPKEDEVKRRLALDTLVLMKASDMIKCNVTVSFGRTSHNEALALAAELRERGLEAEAKEDVHAQTLQAFVREALRNGEAIEPEKLGINVIKLAKIKRTKVKPKTSSRSKK